MTETRDKDVWHNGKFQCVFQRGYGEGTFVIRIKDETSTSEMIEIEISPAALALAMTGQQTDARFKMGATKYVGTLYQHKNEFVPCDPFIDPPHDQSPRLIPFEVEGWKGRADDLKNSHRRVHRFGILGHNVTFVRHIDPATGKSVS